MSIIESKQNTWLFRIQRKDLFIHNIVGHKINFLVISHFLNLYKQLITITLTIKGNKHRIPSLIVNVLISCNLDQYPTLNKFLLLAIRTFTVNDRFQCL